MAQSKASKERKTKKEQYREKVRKENAQKAIPKSHLIPLTEWESTTEMVLRGDLLEAIENQAVSVYQHLAEAQNILAATQKEFQALGQVIQMVMSQNMKDGKIKLNYTWNNGDEPTEAEIKDYEDQVNKLRATQKEAYEKWKAEENAKQTGLVGPDGAPAGTAQDLSNDEEEKQDTEESKDEAPVSVLATETATGIKPNKKKGK